MKTPYVKISTVRKYGKWGTILGYRPVLIITNSLTRSGNLQTVHMGVISPLEAKVWPTEEKAQQAYDNGIPVDYNSQLKYPEHRTDELHEINDNDLWRTI